MGRGDSSQMPSETTTVLLVDPSNTVTDRLSEELGHHPPIRLQTESDLDRAQSRVASTAIDGLVLNLDSLDEAERQAFVTNIRTTDPTCPIILFTKAGADAIDDDLLTQTTTLVERTDDPDNWAFLIAKIQSALPTASSDRHDSGMYRTLVESARDGLYRLNANGEVVYANESWAELLGYDRNELLGKHASQAMADGELERGQRLIQQVLDDDDRESDIIDLEMITNDGDHITVAVHFVVLTTEEGVYDGVVGVARDVTERRANEQQLEQKNERLDEFASIVSHDLRNPLSVANGRLTLAQEECDSEHLEAVDHALTRIDALIENLLTLAREGEQVREMESTDLAAVAEQCWRNVETADATLRTRIDRLIQADRSRLKQLLENLIRNAIEHGGDDVAVTVVEMDDGFYVADDGPGIPAEERDDVFNVGYSEKEGGTGFGLSIVKEIVDAHGWEVRVAESADGGTRFEITGIESAA
jgi:PAS domain S-box-containing protein